jgi:uncharacterized membrane protein
MNKNILISIIVIAIAMIAASSYFNHDHENSLNEFGHEIGHELDEIGDNIKKK